MSIREHMKTALANVRSLRSAPRELWLAYVNIVFAAYADFALAVTLVLFLKGLGFSDQEAGTMYGIFGALTTLYGFVVGFIVDNIGVKWALVLGLLVQSASKFGLAFIPNSSNPALYALLYFFIPMGEAMSIPVINTSLRRYTTLSQRAFTYGLLYSFMNVGVIGAGWGTDIVRHFVGAGIQSGTNYLTPPRIMCLTMGAALLIPLLITLVFVREISLNERGEMEKFHVKAQAPWTIIREVAGTKSFWKYVLLAVLLANVRSVFRHLEATMPTYMIRTFGKDAPYGMIYSINPIIIVFLTPVAQILTGRFKALVMIIIGAWISASSPGWMGIGNAIAFCGLFVVQLSLGETLWSSRTMGYATSVAPKGREGTFSAIASIPIFLSKLPAGVLSGFLLSKYCPAEGNCNGRVLWLIVMGIALASPLLISLLYKVIYDPLADKPAEAHGNESQSESNEYVLLEELEGAAKPSTESKIELEGEGSGSESD